MEQLTEAQYQAVLALYHHCNEDFKLISESTRTAFFGRLLGEITEDFNRAQITGEKW